ncbi:MAG: primosomal protein N', partial [Coxiella sp. (in: Bacteria)]
AWHHKRYHYVTLPERVGNAKTPQIRLIDLKNERLQAGLSPYLIATMTRHLDEGGQVLLFLNRRGYAPVYMCHHCGYSEQCPRCDTYLTVHHHHQQLRCHHCEYIKKCPKICSQCHQADMMPVGLGTERIENELATLFKDENIIRIDRDTTRKKGMLEDLLQEAHNKTANILIGTQMLAKGHHFSGLTLVAVIDADSGLFSTDFRALERLAQLLVQVAGRAGRENKVGEVLIQTHHPDHPMLQTLLQSGYTAFAKQLLEKRKLAELPPHSHMALFRSEHSNEALPHSFLSELKKRLQSFDQARVELLGPIAAPMPRRAGKFRAQLLLQADNRNDLQRILDSIMSDTWMRQQKRKIPWTLDVDPVELL